MIKRKYVVLSLLTLVSIMFGSLLYSNLVSAQSSTVTSYLSVPAAAFVPCNSTKNNIIGDYIANHAGIYESFVGPVQLPHGATVTNMTFYYYDAYWDYIRLYLHRYSLVYSNGTADAVSLGDTGVGSNYDDTIYFATVDNSEFAYYLWVIMPRQPYYEFRYVIIEYTLPSEAAGAVGGLYIPADKLSLLAPYIALVSTIILAVSISVAYIKYRKKH